MNLLSVRFRQTVDRFLLSLDDFSMSMLGSSDIGLGVLLF